MKISVIKYLALIILMSMLLSACQTPQLAEGHSQAASQLQAATSPVVVAATSTPRSTLTQEPVASQTPTMDVTQARASQAEQTARAYFGAVVAGDSQKAAGLLSSFSLMVAQMTRGDAVSTLQTQKIAGVRWSDLQILETQHFDTHTILVKLSYREKKIDAAAQSNQVETIEALWPVRLENGAWLYNWENLIDFRSLDARAQTTNNVTVMPVQLKRYSDRLQLTMLIQNRSNAVVVFGQQNETLGVFTFGDQTVTTEDTQMILNPLRSVPNATLEAKGLFTSFPDTIEIRRWKDYDVDPWYVFQLQ